MIYFPTISVAGVNADPKHQAYLKELMCQVQNSQEDLQKKHQPISITIFPEPDNPYDKNAIKIEINNKPVGYVARKDQIYFDFNEYAELQGSIVSWGIHNGDAVYLWIQPELLCMKRKKRKLSI